MGHTILPPMATPLLLLLLLFPLPSLSLSDSDSLLLLKSSLKNTDRSLSSWLTASPPCSYPRWKGVLCFRGNVTGLRLGHLNLTGYINIHALSQIPSLRTISFVNNSFYGPFPNFNKLDALKSIYVSNNHFSGPIADDFFAPMDHLKKLWIDGNNLVGPIPSSLGRARSLLELHVENNGFSGEIPDFKLPLLWSFNGSGNEFSGPVPGSLVRFGALAFLGNGGLCGPPIDGPGCKGIGPAVGPVGPRFRAVVAPGVKGRHLGIWIVVGLGLGFVVLMVVGLALFKRRGKVGDLGLGGGAKGSLYDLEAAGSAGRRKSELGSGGRRRYGSGKGGGGAGGGGGGNGSVLVMVKSERDAIGLSDLMNSAAEVLGNGSLGSAYKAVMSGDFAVAVKRMRELNRLTKDLFDGEMKRFGRLNHPNVLNPIAYHYRKEEKLIVFDYVPKGSLLYILHGDRGADHAALDWPTRLKIILGIARGMSYLHAELVSYEIPHANLKTANVLLSPTFDPLLADYGLIALINPDVAPTVLFSFKSPEAQHLRHVSPKSDVYCFGIVLLEILTGKFPSQYLNNAKGGTDVVQWTASAIADSREADLLDPEITGKVGPTVEMVRLVRFAAACTQLSPDERPEMREAAEFVEEIAAAVGPVGNLEPAPVGSAL